MSDFFHKCPDYLINPTHPITINLIGCGGTGSHVLAGLARMHHALTQLDHPGFFVQVWDADTVSETNIGRQLFSPAELGMNKAVVMVSRINRFFGLNWEAMPQRYGLGLKAQLTPTTFANLTITCVDSVAARREVYGLLHARFTKEQRQRIGGEPYSIPMYWLDYGNLRHSGQVILGSVGCDNGKVKVEKGGSLGALPDLFDLFPAMGDDGELDTPSCSMRQALMKQDLFINSTLANLGMNLLWSLFRNQRIFHHGYFLNMESGRMNPLMVRPMAEKRQLGLEIAA